MDTSNVKSIYDNSIGKEVKKIQDANGNIIWYKVPDGFTKLTYIHGDGNQYINTGYEANANIELIFKYKSDLIPYPNSISSTRCIIGGRMTVQNGISLWERDGNYQYGKGSTKYPAVQQAIENTDIHTVKIAKGGNLYVDGTKILTYTSGTSFPSGSYVYLFSTLSQSSQWTRTSDSTDMRTMIGQFYYCIVKNNNVVVRHLIPMLRNSDNKPGMYDLVNDIFYTNVGTGEFTWE